MAVSLEINDVSFWLFHGHKRSNIAGKTKSLEKYFFCFACMVLLKVLPMWCQSHRETETGLRGFVANKNLSIMTTFKRTVRNSEEKVESILNRVFGEGTTRLLWEIKPKDYRFKIMGYFVRGGEIIVIQIMDDGSTYEFLPTRGATWDSFENALRNHYGEDTKKELTVS